MIIQDVFQQSVSHCQSVIFLCGVSHQTVSGVKLWANTKYNGTEEERESKDPVAVRKRSDQMSCGLKLFFFSFLITGGGWLQDVRPAPILCVVIVQRVEGHCEPWQDLEHSYSDAHIRLAAAGCAEWQIYKSSHVTRWPEKRDWDIQDKALMLFDIMENSQKSVHLSEAQQPLSDHKFFLQKKKTDKAKYLNMFDSSWRAVKWWFS